MRATRIGKNGKPHISEKAFTAQVISLAQHLGWKVAHFRPAMNKKGEWRTAVQGDGAGFPDLVLAKRESNRVIFAELKADGGRITDEQSAWLYELSTGALAVIWRPSDYEEIERILR